MSMLAAAEAIYADAIDLLPLAAMPQARCRWRCRFTLLIQRHAAAEKMPLRFAFIARHATPLCLPSCYASAAIMRSA